ncbi:MAG TPA: leucine-rich repeat domain-containing protein [Clostridia bacterium]|nr:leucine-rich repeat domain-containing protein [Clostridia bacterium]
MKDAIESYKAEFETFWGQLVALPAQIEAAYDICTVLSEGNGKTTYLVAAKESGTRYIVKTADQSCAENIETEYTLLHLLKGNGFPHAIAYMQDDSLRYLIREYVEGDTLEAYLAQHGVFSEEETVHIAYELCSIVLRLHSLNKPVIHRDIKPQNIIYTPQHNCILIDLGAARYYDKQLEKDTVCLGSAIVAAPEQFGYQQTDVRSDIYALGILMLYLCTGSYDLARCGGIKNKHLAGIIRRCTRFDPDDRYSSVHRLQIRLSRILPAQRLHFQSFYNGILLGLILGIILSFSLTRFLSLRPQAIALNTAPVAASATVSPAKQPVVFSSAFIERAVRETLDIDANTAIYESDLDQITQLLILGNSVYTDWDSFLFHAIYFQPQGDGTLSSLEDISKFKHLNILGIADQKLVDLSSLEQSSVEKLVLSHNLVVDITALSKMPCLREVYLNGNPISDVSILSTVPTLTTLDISETNVSDLSPFCNSRLRSLRFLDTPISEYSPLLEMPQLEELALDRLNDKGVSICSQLTQLVKLTMIETPGLTDLAPLSGLTNLSFLDLSKDGVQSISGIAQFTNLDYLCLTGNPVNDFTPLVSAPRLRALNISGMELGDYGFVSQIQSLKTIYCDAKQKELILQQPGMDQIEFIVS